ncbi:hypothetical protein EC957_009747 [Mortierella hygrophila]|uniref:Uncharacterized protein n=1 Tax=Mortierella hygrophila TaxID=979708 RepID=A0A9P6FAQ0_9FUNG|nr:hypothetical protein EC957_009747 [Mortierella hygrophila]
MAADIPEEATVAAAPEATTTTTTTTTDTPTTATTPAAPARKNTSDDLSAIVAIGNDILVNGNGHPSSGPATPSVGTEEKNFSFSNGGDDNEDDFHDAIENLPATRKLHQRLSTYSPQVRETQEWEQIMQDWERVMAEKRIQDAKLNLVEQENKRMKSQLVEAEAAKADLEKESQERIQQLEKTNKDLSLQAKDPAKEKKALMNQLEESDAEKELFKLMLEETEGEKKRVEQRLAQIEKEKDQWSQKTERVKNLKSRLRLKSAQFSLLSTSTSTLLTQDLEGVRPDKERKRLMDQVTTLESDRSRLAAMVKNTMNSTDSTSDASSKDVSTLSNSELVSENQRLDNELQMARVENSLLQRRIEAFEVTLHDVRVALTNSEAHAESLEAKKYDLQDKLAAAEGSLDRSRIESKKYQALHKEMLEKNDKLDREMQVIKARFEAKDRVLMTTQKQLAAAKVDGGLLKTIRRELESVLFDYNTVVQHFMDIQVQAMGAKALANALKRQNNELQVELTHFRTMLLGIKSFNNNDPIKSPTVTTLRSEFRVLLEKIQEEQNNQVDRERADKFKAQDWNRKLRMEKDFMKLELQNQIEKWRRVSVYWEDKWRRAANDLHEAVTTGVNSDYLFEAAAQGSLVAGNNAHNISPRASVLPPSKRSSLAISTAAVNTSTGQDAPLTPSAMKQNILDNKIRSGSASNLNSAASVASPASATASSSITDSLTDLVKPFLGRSLSQNGSSGRGPSNPTSRLAAAASLRTPIAAGLPSNATGTGAMGSTAVSKASLRSKNMASSAIGSARNQALQAGVPGAVVTAASQEAQSRANSSISSVSKSVDSALSESDRLKADVRRMLNR